MLYGGPSQGEVLTAQRGFSRWIWFAAASIRRQAHRPMSASLSVVICSLNGAAGVDRCLQALESQTIRSQLELVVVDDGWPDDTSEGARNHGTLLVRHDACRGLSAARNSGIRIASAPVIAFLDDDCEPEPDWAEQLLSSYQADVLAIGGALVGQEPTSFMLGYLHRHNPLAPLELELAASHNRLYRLWLYVKGQWSPSAAAGRRPVFSFAGGNMAVRREALIDIGGFDERIRFGGDDDDLFLRLSRARPGSPLIFDPAVRVLHHFEPSLRDTVRRSRMYGRGRALLYRKWPSTGFAAFPYPVVVLVTLVLSGWLPVLAIVAVALPQLCYPLGIRAAVANRDARCLLDPYVQLAQEAYGNVGFIQGLWRFRHLSRVLPPGTARDVDPNWESHPPPGPRLGEPTLR